MSGARASDSSSSSDDDDEEEELAHEFENLRLTVKRAAIAAERAAILKRSNKKVEAQYREAGERMELEMAIRAWLRQLGVCMQNLPYGWGRAIRVKGKAQEKPPTFMDQKVENQMLKRDEQFTAEQVLNALHEDANPFDNGGGSDDGDDDDDDDAWGAIGDQDP